MMTQNKENNNAFQEYELSKEMIDALTLLGYTQPTEIQKKVIPMALDFQDIVAKSQTGTGKTAAFAIPICEKVVWEGNMPQALILEPTRELAAQVSDEIFHIGRNKRLKVPAVFGGFPIDKQIQTLRQKAHIVVGTPGRVLDHIKRNSLKLEQIRYVVIDEADLMLDMGFIEDVKRVLALVPNPFQTMLFSATLKDSITDMITEYMTNPIYIDQEEETQQGLAIEHIIYEVEEEEKFEVFLNVLMNEHPESCMIFCGTREMVNVLYQKLKRKQIYCGVIHGEIEQKERMKTIERFRMGALRYLIVTDIASRGVDFENMTHVFQYDFPTGKETYVHRAGRTGRNGQSGAAISFLCPQEQNMRQQVEAYTGIEFTVGEYTREDVGHQDIFWKQQKQKLKSKVKKGAAFNKTITRLTVGGGRKSKMRTVDIVGAICSIDTIQAEDIGIIDIRDSFTYVEILGKKGTKVFDALQTKPIKGKVRKVKIIY